MNDPSMLKGDSTIGEEEVLPDFESTTIVSFWIQKTGMAVITVRDDELRHLKFQHFFGPNNFCLDAKGVITKKNEFLGDKFWEKHAVELLLA